MSSDDGSDIGSDDDILRDNVKMDADNILRNIMPNNAANNLDDINEEDEEGDYQDMVMNFSNIDNLREE